MSAVSSFWWKIFLGTAFLVIPGSLLLLPFVLAVMERQRAQRRAQAAESSHASPISVRAVEVSVL